MFIEVLLTILININCCFFSNLEMHVCFAHDMYSCVSTDSHKYTMFLMSHIVVCAPSMYSCLAPPPFRYRTGGAEVRTGQFFPQGSGRLLQTDPISRETAQEHEAGKRWPAEGTQLHTSNVSHYRLVWKRCIISLERYNDVLCYAVCICLIFTD